MCEYLETGSFQVSGATDVVMFRGNSWLCYEFFTKLLCRTLKGLCSSPKGKPLEVNVLWLVCVITSRLEHVNLRLYSHLASNEVWGKVMFLLVSAILSTGGRSLSRGRLCASRSLSRGSLSGRPPNRDSVKSGWCVSYRNAFLYISQYTLVRRLKLIWSVNVVAALMLTLNVNGSYAMFSYYRDLSFLRAFIITSSDVCLLGVHLLTDKHINKHTSKNLPF